MGKYKLWFGYWNKFLNGETKISIKIYALSGRLIITLLDGIVEPGVHSLSWDCKDAKGNEVPVGIYFCRLETENKFQSKKMVMLR